MHHAVEVQQIGMALTKATFFYLFNASSIPISGGAIVDQNAGRDLNELARLPNIKRVHFKQNPRIPSSTLAEPSLSKGHDVFSIKRKKLSDDTFERQLIPSYSKLFK